MQSKLEKSKDSGDVKFLRVLICVLAVCIVGLVVGNVVVWNTKDEDDKIEGLEWIEQTTALEEKFKEKYEIGGIESARKVYDKYINDTEDGMSYRTLRIQVTEDVCGVECSQYIMEDVWALDMELNPMLVSAYRCEYEGKYGDADMAEEYCVKSWELLLPLDGQESGL